MEFQISKSNDAYVVKEKDRVIFTSDYEYEEHLLSLHLRNIYGDEAISAYQVKKWYTAFHAKHCVDFTIYEGENKRGELHKEKEGFYLDYQGVTYHFFGGVQDGCHQVVCFDRTQLCAHMIFDKECKVSFDNSTIGAMMALLCVLFQEFNLNALFSQAAFEKKFETIPV